MRYKDMAEVNFTANQEMLGNYIQIKEITLLDHKIRMVRIVDDRNDKKKSATYVGFLTGVRSLPHFSKN
jgi:hypothetical protein